MVPVVGYAKEAKDDKANDQMLATTQQQQQQTRRLDGNAAQTKRGKESDSCGAPSCGLGHSIACQTSPSPFTLTLTLLHLPTPLPPHPRILFSLCQMCSKTGERKKRLTLDCSLLSSTPSPLLAVCSMVKSSSSRFGETGLLVRHD